MRAHPILLAILLLGLLAGCDSSDDEADIVGQYETTQFLVQLDGEPVDVLAAGGFIEMTLREDGTASGRVFVPAELAGGEENDLEFDGTYTVSGDEVRFQHEADTFVRDVVWTFDGGRLRAETETLSVVLRKA